MDWLHKGLPAIAAGVLLGVLGMTSPAAQLQPLAPTGTAPTEHRSVPRASGMRAVRISLPDGERLELAASGDRLLLYPRLPGSPPRMWSLAELRRGASLTRLPDGRVLLLGGADASGRLQQGGYWFDTELRDLQPTQGLPTGGRAGHTATVLTDGRVLLAGGITEGATLELWDPTSGRIERVNAMRGPAAGHSATLEADGRVRLFGSQAGGARTYEALYFDPAQGTATPSQSVKPSLSGSVVSGSLPEQGSAVHLARTPLAIRFSDPVGMDALSNGEVTLFGPGGATPVRIVVAEQGRIAFMHPRQALFPGAQYTLMVDGVRSLKGRDVPLFVLDFSVATQGQSPVVPRAGTTQSSSMIVNTGGAGARCQAEVPCLETAVMDEGRWTPGQDSLGQNWRAPGRQPDAHRGGVMSQLFAAWRMTGLSGRILRADGLPVGGVAVNLGALTARTDAQGFFLMLGAPAGRQVLHVDGSAANKNGAEYGQFAVGVDVTDGILNEVPFTMWLPRISARDKIQIPSPTMQDMVLKHPDLPGMELHLPAGTVIRDQKGRIVTEIAIVPTPVNRSPYPLPADFPMYFTLQPGGAVLQGLTPAAGRGARVFYPNYDKWPAGTAANFWLYDPREGWRVYGQGRVTDDERQFAPEPGVSLREVVAFGASVEPNDPPPEPDMPPDPQECGEENAGSGCNATAGDPIDLKTGRFTYEEMDIQIKDVVPLIFGRNYRPSDRVKREFGFGTAASFGYRLSTRDSSRNTMHLVLPNGASIDFVRTSGTGSYGSWSHASGTSYAGATLATYSDDGYYYRLTLRDGSQMRFEPYAPNALVWSQDRFGNRTTYVRDAGRVVRIESSNGRNVELNHDTQGRIASAADALGNTWSYTYNSTGLLERVVHPDGSERRYGYQSWGTGPTLRHRLQTIHDQRGNRLLYNEFETSIGSDGAEQTSGRVVRQTLADGAVYVMQYDHAAHGSVGTLVTHPDGSQRRIVFGESGYPLSDTLGYGTALAQTHTFERDAQARLASRTDALGRRTEYEYDARGLQTRVTELAGTQYATSTSVAYDAQGNMTSTTDAAGNMRMLEHLRGCLVGQSDPLGATYVYSCTTAGLPATVHDPLGGTANYVYISGNLVELTDAAGRRMVFRHDALGRPIATEDPMGNISRQEYDRMGRVVKDVSPDGSITERGYDANGNLAAVLLPHGAGQLFEYDTRDRMSKRTDSLGQTESWSHDGMGRTTRFTDRRGNVTTYQYDVIGRLAEVTFADGNRITTQFDAGNRLLRLTDTVSGDLSWTYDGTDNIVSETTPLGTVSYTYDAGGRRASLQVTDQPLVHYAYDANDQMRSIVQGTHSIDLDYDALGRPVKLTLPNGVEAGYSYGAVGEVTGLAWQRPGQPPLATAGYAYDKTGRTRAQTGSWADGPQPEAIAGNTFDDNARQTLERNQPVVHDPNGNLLQRAGRTYEWDARNRLVEIREGASVIASYGYDAVGRRIMRREQGIEIRYQYDGNDIVNEWHGSIAVPLLSIPGTGWRLARGAGDQLRWYMTDVLRSTRGLLDSAGNLIQQYHFDPYGNSADAPGLSVVENPYLYAGRERDQSGLYFMGARYYDASLMRFISEDPLLFADGPNPYSYVGNAPLDFVDADGLQRGPPAQTRPPVVRPGYRGYAAGSVRNPGPQPAPVRLILNQDNYKWQQPSTATMRARWREGFDPWFPDNYPDMGKRPPPCSTMICGPGAGLPPDTPPSCPIIRQNMSGPDGPATGCRCL
ncbi:RHS repeat-associated core domain-containing protein [Stenotrophomonas rhizophila]